jgi:hypothetical protein
MSRKPNANVSKKVQPVLSAQFRDYLDQLVDLGYGKTPTEAARYLIDRGIDDLIRAKTIGPGTLRTAARKLRTKRKRKR